MTKRICTNSLVSLVMLLSACSPSGNMDQNRATNPGASVAEPVVSSMEGFVYTANERGNSISEIDIGTGQVRTIATPFTPTMSRFHAMAAGCWRWAQSPI